MRTVTIDELQNHTSSLLQFVRDGEEVVVEDRDVPIARILPLFQNGEREREARLVAAGALKMPEEVMDWDNFFRMPAGNVPQEIAVQAVIDGRGDR